MNFRRGVATPKVLRLHRDDVRPEDRETLYGVPVTNAMRAILDVWKEGSLSKPALCAAFREALKRGTITKTQVATRQQDTESARVLAEIRKGLK